MLNDNTRENWKGESIWEFPLFVAQFFCKPKAALKNKVY